MANRNALSREAYLKTIAHPRKNELATMILDGASVEELNAAGFGRINILEAARDIRLKVEGKEDLSYDIPRGTGGDSTSAEDIARTADADAEQKKSSSPQASDSESSQASVPGRHADDATPGEGSVDQTAPSGDVVPGTTADEPTLNPTETLGGNPVGTLTGEEDPATLQQKADEAATGNEPNKVDL